MVYRYTTNICLRINGEEVEFEDAVFEYDADYMTAELDTGHPIAGWEIAGGPFMNMIYAAGERSIGRSVVCDISGEDEVIRIEAAVERELAEKLDNGMEP